MTSDNSFGVNIFGYFSGAFGLAESGRLIVECLKSNDFPLSLISTDHLAPHHNRIVYSEKISNETKYDINLFCIGQQEITAYIEAEKWTSFKKRYNIAIWFWETNVIPESHLSCLKYLDEIWVTSKYMQEHLSSKTDLPIKHFPQPIKLNFCPDLKKEKNNFNKPFTFLFCFDFFGIVERKNPLAVVKAFKKAFDQNSQAQLIIKSQNGFRLPLKLKKYKDAIADAKNIIWMDESLSVQDHFTLMNSCDCYISLHRSEGFGLSLAEAMLLGKPVIGTNYSGNLDFMNPDNSYLCNYDFVNIGPGNYPYPENGIWSDVNIDHAAKQMLKVFNNPEEAKLKALEGKALIEEVHSCKSVGYKLKQRLKQIKPPSKSRKIPKRLIKIKIKSAIKVILKPILKPAFNLLRRFLKST